MEAVWDYPRPPALVPCTRRVRIELGGALIADSTRALRVLETSHPPTVYVPPQDIAAGHLTRVAGRRSLCEFKGQAHYYDVEAGDEHLPAAAWAYADPTPAFTALRDHVAFYPSRLRCRLDDEPVQAQEGDFYGGWITQDLVGPFKGGPGTLGW